VYSQHVHPKQPPDKEYRDDGPRDVNYPVARCFRFPKIEHTAMVAGPAQVAKNHDSPTIPLEAAVGAVLRVVVDGVNAWLRQLFPTGFFKSIIVTVEQIVKPC
jgi:hypothetical protein